MEIKLLHKRRHKKHTTRFNFYGVEYPNGMRIIISARSRKEAVKMAKFSAPNVEIHSAKISLTYTGDIISIIYKILSDVEEGNDIQVTKEAAKMACDSFLSMMTYYDVTRCVNLGKYKKAGNKRDYSW